MGPLGIHLVDSLLLQKNETMTLGISCYVYWPWRMLVSFWFCRWRGYSPTPHSLKSQLPKWAIRLIPKTCSSTTTLCASPNPDGIWLNALLANRVEISENETCLASPLYTFGLISSNLIKPFCDWQKLVTSRSAGGTKYFQFSLQDNRHPEQF